MATLVGEDYEPARSASRPSRTPLHKAKDGELVPGTFAGADELLAIARMPTSATACSRPRPTIREGARVVLVDAGRSRRETGQPVVVQPQSARPPPDLWHRRLRLLEDAQGGGLEDPLAQVAGPPGRCSSEWVGDREPVHAVARPGRLIGRLTRGRAWRRTRPPRRSKALLTERSTDRSGARHHLDHSGAGTSCIRSATPTTNPTPTRAAIAKARGVDPAEVAYDQLMSRRRLRPALLPALQLLEPQPRSPLGASPACPYRGWGSPTAARTAASSRTRACRPSCSSSGHATAARRTHAA